MLGHSVTVHLYQIPRHGYDYYAPAPVGGGGIIITVMIIMPPPPVCLSDVAYIGSNSKNQKA